jgi:PAS domain-containing protein
LQSGGQSLVQNRVILPAQSAHASIAESEAFSRAVIDTAPTGLCVIRRSDHRVLLQNQRAQQWQDYGQLMSLLTSRTGPGHADRTRRAPPARRFRAHPLSGPGRLAVCAA